MCTACDEGKFRYRGLDAGTTPNISSLGVLLVLRGGLDSRGLDTGTT